MSNMRTIPGKSGGLRTNMQKIRRLTALMANAAAASGETPGGQKEKFSVPWKVLARRSLSKMAPAAVFLPA
jgi:hypothetical protein